MGLSLVLFRPGWPPVTRHTSAMTNSCHCYCIRHGSRAYSITIVSKIEDGLSFLKKRLPNVRGRAYNICSNNSGQNAQSHSQPSCRVITTDTVNTVHNLRWHTSECTCALPQRLQCTMRYLRWHTSECTCALPQRLQCSAQYLRWHTSECTCALPQRLQCSSTEGMIL